MTSSPKTMVDIPKQLTYSRNQKNICPKIMKGSNGQNPHTTREKLPTNRKGPHLSFAVLSFESYCTLICKHKKTNSIQTFIQSIKDVAHHHIVKESKEKADNDDSESKTPDENDK